MIISGSEIMYPKVVQANVLICLTQEAYNKYASIIRPGGLLITDSRHVKTERKVDARQKELPLFQQGMDKIGKQIVFNICMLGAVNRLVEMNKKALQLGIDLADESG